jgi:hypothetical protein
VKADVATQASLSQALTKGACAICGILKEFVPLRFRTVIGDVVERNRSELRGELEVFHEQLKHGMHAGGGLLGRVAEFLVGQREL